MTVVDWKHLIISSSFKHLHHCELVIQVICLNGAHKKRSFLFPQSPDSGLTAEQKLEYECNLYKKKSNCVQWCTSAAVCVVLFFVILQSQTGSVAERGGFWFSSVVNGRVQIRLFSLCCVCWCKYGEKSIYMNKSWFRFIHIRRRGCCLNVSLFLMS